MPVGLSRGEAVRLSKLAVVMVPEAKIASVAGRVDRENSKDFIMVFVRGTNV